MFDDSFDKLNIVIQKYDSFYKLLGNASLSQIHTIFEPFRNLNQINYPVTTMSCEEACHDIAAAAFGYAEQQHESSLSNIVSWGRDLYSAIAYHLADQLYLQETNCIIYELNACIDDAC